jgi:chromosomal replication initiation ATPase DnaA
LKKKKKIVGAICPMNAKNNLNDPAYFISDPWTKTESKPGLWNKFVAKNISEIVNTNSNKKINYKTLTNIMIILIKSFRFVNTKIYLNLFIKSLFRKWNKALILDLILHDIHIKLIKKNNTDFSTIFFNAGAHIQHHYFLNSFFVKKFSNIKNHYSIKDIIISDFNKEVYQYLFELNNWQSQFLFIYGNKGVGKTLLSKIYIQNKSGIHISLSDLTDISKIDYILQTYKNIAIDNITTLTKEQEIILIHLYNSTQGLKEHNLIFISRKAPNQFVFNTNDLKSRFFSMISLQITEPSDDVLKALFIKNLTDKQFVITKSILDLIFTHSKRDCQTLIDLANKIDNFLATNNKKLTISIIKDIINNMT